MATSMLASTTRAARVVRLTALAVALPFWTSCETVLPPLRGEIDVGRDAYGVFVGGDDRASDLYAFTPNGGPALQITYTAVAELAPVLSPDGASVALLRAATLRDSLPGTAWVLDLRSGTERELELPRGSGSPRRLGWAASRSGHTNLGGAAGGSAVYIAADSGVYRFDPPVGQVKARKVDGAEHAAAESSFAVLLGEPVFTRVVKCASDTGSLCVVGDKGAEAGTPELLARGARDPVRWGPDSVAYFVKGMLEVRPLGPGRARWVRWTNSPTRPRAATFFPGVPGQATVSP